MAKAAAQPFVLPSRQVHLDFHTGPCIPDVGQDFDAREFARTVKQAHINSITLFAKCHHGHLYYNTKRPERHPGLKKGFDLLAAQVEALHREGIRAPIYLSVQCDEYAANTHPEWVARNPDSSQVKWTPRPERVFDPGWQILDMSSPYADYLADQTAEVLKLFHPVDGIFYDMTWDQPSCTQWAIDGMIKENLNPEKAEDRAIYANRVSKRYMKRYFDQIKARVKNASVFYNSRPFTKFAEEFQWQTQAEIE
ncbi:MAG: alpha-L-fucosidase, partial [Phycisphaerae bacterium]